MHRLALGLLSLAAACGGDGSDIQGFYMTTSHTLNDQGCEAEGDDLDDPPYFRIEKESFFGVPIRVGESCTSGDEADCSDSGDLGFFASKEGGAFVGETFLSSGGIGGSACLLAYQLDRAAGEGDEVFIERRRFQEEDESLQDEACDPDEAEARGESMPCVELAVLEGVLAEPM